MSTRKIRTIITSAATLTLAAGVAATTAGAASASTLAHPAAQPRWAAGSVQLGNPLQDENFLALQGFGHNHGEVDYTNFTYASPGSGVWAPMAGSHAIVFGLGGSNYAHTLDGGLKLTAKSPERLAFSGTGSYNGPGGITWTIKGQVHKGDVKAEISYNGQSYTVTLTGKIASDGSMTGTAVSSQGQDLTVAMPAGSWFSVLHFDTRIQTDRIGNHDATFVFTIPASSALGGTSVTVTVHDGGRGNAHDTYAHGVTGSPPLTQYPIIGGPGITVR